jgi:FkbM family methyltransferase
MPPAPLMEYVAHRLIGTRLEIPIRRLRNLSASLRSRLQTRDLQEIHAEPQRIEAVMQRLIRDPMSCVDVGCHLGGLLQIMVQCSPRGRHIGIEPTPYKIGWLRKKYPQVTFHQVAVSDGPGETEFFVAHRSALSAPVLDSNRPRAVNRLLVRCDTLDDLITDGRSIDFIKLGAPTGELAMLRGAQQTIERCQPIILFVCTKSGLEALNTPPRAVYELLVQGHGYNIFLMKDWLSQRPALTFERFVQSMEYPFQTFRFLAIPARGC